MRNKKNHGQRYVIHQGCTLTLVLIYKTLMIMEKNEKSQERKKGRVNGSITQKVYSFRLDGDLIEWLYRQPNKGRYLNNLIRDDMEKYHL